MLSLFYLRIGWLVRMMEKVPALQKVVNHIRVLDEFDNIQLIRIFSLSLCRYMVFVLQYLLLLQVMQVEIACGNRFLADQCFLFGAGNGTYDWFY